MRLRGDEEPPWIDYIPFLYALRSIEELSERWADIGWELLGKPLEDFLEDVWQWHGWADSFYGEYGEETVGEFGRSCRNYQPVFSPDLAQAPRIGDDSSEDEADGHAENNERDGAA